MQLHYFATLRDIAKKREEVWTEPAPTLRELVQGLIARYGNDFDKWLLKDGVLSHMAIILINGADARGLQGLDTPLPADADISIFPPLAGG